MNNNTDSKSILRALTATETPRNYKSRPTTSAAAGTRPSAFMKYSGHASMQHEMNPPTTAELRAEMQRAFIMSRISLSIKGICASTTRSTVSRIAPIKGMSIDRCYEITRGGETVALGRGGLGDMRHRNERFVRPEQHFGFGFSEPHGSRRRIAIPRISL